MEGRGGVVIEDYIRPEHPGAVAFLIEDWDGVFVCRPPC